MHTECPQSQDYELFAIQADTYIGIEICIHRDATKRIKISHNHTHNLELRAIDLKIVEK